MSQSFFVLWLCSNTTLLSSKAISGKEIARANPKIFFHGIFCCKYISFFFKMRLYKPHQQSLVVVSGGVSEFQMLAFLDAAYT